MLEENKTDVQAPRNFVRKLRIAIVRSSYNKEMTESLEGACLSTLLREGLLEENIETVLVPGALEIPIVVQALARTGRFQTIIALGVVLKGDTYHFELVANESTGGCMRVALEEGVPVVCEILSVYSKKQGEKRTGDNDLNKGIEAARTAIGIASTLSDISAKHEA
jgi:6,7-dimethyl-8-ribityllumazine synthase